ncbi:hypothetical protein [Candidatus Deianiraea vastatrix]|uniref:Zinc/manganese ABC transporter substrate binding protein n=1 Tax=Candidatus Deianiraea vastatrix TaxID=2163644 RepID=A0A5B8XCY2_9RICK|nr:hypothetical protein [Candidatus Deianiraea vastatrix]QED23182.1 Putative zinc/manganese ABC transporter substrate binding protein [Candidatus Deianiraea vastatrix]
MLKFACIFVILFINTSFAKPKIAADHPFIISAISQMSPNKFEYIKVYSKNAHDGIYLKPNEIRKISSADLTFSISHFESLKQLKLKNKVINLADCSILKDEFCSKDKHFWLSSDVACQIYEQILSEISIFLEKNEINQARKIINGVKNIKNKENLSCHVLTSHNFGTRLSKIVSIDGYIFHNGSILPKVLESIQNKPYIIVSDGKFPDELRQKIHKDSKVVIIDADGMNIDKYETYINNISQLLTSKCTI